MSPQRHGEGELWSDHWSRHLIRLLNRGEQSREREGGDWEKREEANLLPVCRSSPVGGPLLTRGERVGTGSMAGAELQVAASLGQSLASKSVSFSPSNAAMLCAGRRAVQAGSARGASMLARLTAPLVHPSAAQAHAQQHAGAPEPAGTRALRPQENRRHRQSPSPPLRLGSLASSGASQRSFAAASAGADRSATILEEQKPEASAPEGAGSGEPQGAEGGEGEGGSNGAAQNGTAAPALDLSMASQLPTNESSDLLLRIRHTSAHVMAMAVQKLFPKAQVTIGPWIAKGFYYDFDLSEPLTDKDLKKIKKEMDRIVNKNLPLRREEVSREEAERRITEIGEPYKLEILQGLKEPITIYHIGDEWWDLCAGPHVESTGALPKKAIELESVAGAYWRGDEKRPMLQRIYGTAWETPEQLQLFRQQQEEAKRRDHRTLGQQLDLFSIQEDAGGGLVFWHPKGARMRVLMEEYWRRKHTEQGYEMLYTPHVAKLDLWKTSGHYDFYRENMFDQMDVEEEQYQLRPMNCPFHIAVYKDRARSYRELPMRWAELGTVYRYERSGTMHGLFRVRGFTQDDAHIFCLPNQMRDEIRGVLDLTETILNDFGFTKLEINLSTRPDKSVGSDKIWDQATQALRDALADKGWAYQVDEGGGAFYGPKIDVKIEDAIGRKWQCSTIQVDFNLPQRFNMTYIGADGTKQQPIMIHRAIFGSIERFFGILTENYAGHFPLWLAPTQIRILPVTDHQLEYCHEAASQLRARGVRAEVASGERLGKLIRNAETQKLPVMAVVGAKELESGTLNVRTHAQELGPLSVDEVATRILLAVESKGSL